MAALRILLDTSAINRLAKEPDLAATFADRIRKTGATCYLPMLAVTEFSDGVPEYRDLRVAGLGRLVLQLPPASVRIAARHQDVINAELAAPITELPVDSQEKANLDVIRGWADADKAQFDLWVDPARIKQLHDDRAFYLDKDRGAADWIRQKADPRPWRR